MFWWWLTSSRVCSSAAGFVFLPALVAALEALLRRWLGRAIEGVVVKDRVNLETGVASRDDMVW